jgi:hypothetical protein
MFMVIILFAISFQLKSSLPAKCGGLILETNSPVHKTACEGETNGSVSGISQGPIPQADEGFPHKIRRVSTGSHKFATE